MQKHALPGLALLALTACQTISPNETTTEDEVTRLAHDQSLLREELKGVMDVFVASREGALGAGTAASSLEVAALNVKLDALGRRLMDMQALLAARSGGTADAAFSMHRSEENDKKMATIRSLGEGLRVLEESHALHCENIANIKVPGYWRRTLQVTSALHEASGIRIPSAAGTQLSALQGVLELTGNELDMGIEGAGLFEVQLPDGSLRYTRNGTFRMDVGGRIVTPEGFLLTDQITIPEATQGISISDDGQVFSFGEGNQLQAIGTVRLHVFPNARSLEPKGRSGFVPTASSGMPQALRPGADRAGRIRQGYIERSNVELTNELVELQLIERQARAIRRALAGNGILVD